MLIERQIAPALIVIGGTLILPDVMNAYGNSSASVSALSLVVGNLLGGAGLYLSALMAADSERNRVFRLTVLLLLGLCAVFFIIATCWAAEHSVGFRAWVIGIFALAPFVGYLAGVRAGIEA